MTHPVPDLPAGGAAVIDGIDVDAVVAVVAVVAGVSRLDGGQYGEVTTYLPGRAVPGVVVGDGRVRVQVRAAWDTEVPLLATAIRAALATVTRNRPVDVMIADIDDPPVASPVPSRRVSRVSANPGVPGLGRPDAAAPAPRYGGA